MEVAEQVAVAAPAEIIVEYFATDAPQWLSSFAKLSWSEAGRSSRQRGSNVRPARSVDFEHVIEIGPIEADGEGAACIAFRWQARGAGPVFHPVDGELRIEPTTHGAVIGVRGITVGDDSRDQVSLTMRLPEVLIRALLGHLRDAIEADVRDQVLEEDVLVDDRPPGFAG